MNKKILFLINGFGIEQVESYSIYDKTLMPNLDKLTKEKIFKTFSNTFLDYKSAYNNFSMGINDALTHTLIDNCISNVEYDNNKMMKYIINEINKQQSNLHVFCYIDSETIYDEIITYITHIKENINGKIFLHIVLCQKSINDYKSIDEGLNKLNYEFGQQVKLGIVTGEDNFYDILLNKELVKSFYTEASEKWKEISKRIEVYVQTKVPPYKARAFAVNYGYRVEEKDQILFFNFSNVDISMFRKEMMEQKYRQFDFSTLGFYSLFPIKSEIQIPFIYNYALASTCFLNNIKYINARCMILDKKDKCGIINYYLTGLRNEVDESLKYYPTDDNFIYDPAKLIEFIKTYDKELLIINTEIDDCKTIEEIQERLKTIDNIIGELEKYCMSNNIGLYISSLYGLEKEMYNAKAELCKVNFYSKVPLIICDNTIDFSNYIIDEGSLFELANTLLFTINNKYIVSGLLRKKSKLFSIFMKKPKKEVKRKEYNINENGNTNK